MVESDQNRTHYTPTTVPVGLSRPRVRWAPLARSPTVLYLSLATCPGSPGVFLPVHSIGVLVHSPLSSRTRNAHKNKHVPRVTKEAKRLVRPSALEPAGRLGTAKMSKRELAVALFAEFVGTFLFQIFGGTEQVAAENGLVLAVCIVMTAKASGGNLNPAVSAGLSVVGALPPMKAVLYGIAQVLGAVCGAILAGVVDLDDNLDPVGFGHWGGENTEPGCHRALPNKARGAVFVLETLGTYLLVSTVCATAVAKPGFGDLAPAYIGTWQRTERQAVALTTECLFMIRGSSSLRRYLDFCGRRRSWSDHGRLLQPSTLSGACNRLRLRSGQYLGLRARTVLRRLARRPDA